MTLNLLPCCYLLFWQRKEDRDYVLYGGAKPDPDAELNENDEVKEAGDDDGEEDEDDDEQKTSVSGTCRIVYLLKIENNQNVLLDDVYDINHPFSCLEGVWDCLSCLLSAYK